MGLMSTPISLKLFVHVSPSISVVAAAAAAGGRGRGRGVGSGSSASGVDVVVDVVVVCDAGIRRKFSTSIRPRSECTTSVGPAASTGGSALDKSRPAS